MLGLFWDIFWRCLHCWQYWHKKGKK